MLLRNVLNTKINKTKNRKYCLVIKRNYDKITVGYRITEVEELFYNLSSEIIKDGNSNQYIKT